MARVTPVIQSFNRGRIDTRALARTDLDRTGLSAEIQTNLIPRVLGSASPRPGFEYKGIRKSSNFSISIPFVFSQDDQAELEFTDTTLRVWVGDSLIATGAGDSTTVANGGFDLNLTSWTDADESGAASAWATGGYMALLGTGTNSAIRYQQCTSSVTQNSVHTLLVIVQRGPVVLKIGSSAGATDYASYTLKTGRHHINFTPTAAAEFYVQFSSALDYTVLVDYCEIDIQTNLEVGTPYLEANLYNLRWSQSADVSYLTCSGYLPRSIERRSNNSWSLVTYEPEDGPFGLINVSEITMTPSAISGDITLTTNKNYWDTTTGHTGELFKLVSAGQNVTAAVTAENTFTDSIFVEGLSRTFSISVTNSFTATVTLQRSTDDASWEDVETYTAITVKTFDDELDNQQWYYRIGVKTGDFTSGTVDLLLSFDGGTRIGIVKITSITSATIANGVVLSHLGSTAATQDWYRSQWSELLGYPSAVTLFESRLFLFGKGRVWGSVVDGYSSHDSEVVGDSGPINRILGSDAFDDIAWGLPLDRLLIGVPINSVVLKSTLLDEPLTPSNFNSKKADGEGAAYVNAVGDGAIGYFIERSGLKLFQLVYASDRNNYGAQDLCSLVPEIGGTGIVRIAVQKKPDTRIHCLRSDGTAGLLVKDDAERVISWIDVSTDGSITDVYTFPCLSTEAEDRVYYTVKRNTDYLSGNDVYYREKWALESETESGSTIKLVDSFVAYASPGSATLTGLTHLEGETVYAWVDGVLEGPFTVNASGEITVSAAPTEAYVGLGYSWQYKSVKLAQGAQLGTSLLQRKRINQLGVIAENIHPTAFEWGPSFTNLYDLPAVEGGQVVDSDTIRSTYDEETFPFDGEWSTDSRICLQASVAKPCTLLAIVYSVETIDKA